MPRRCGPNCSPRSGGAFSSSTGSCTTNGVTSCVSLVFSRMDLTRELMSLFAAVLMVSIVVGLMTVVVAPTHITEEQCSMPIQNHGGYATVSCWLGFGFNSTLGYPGEGPPVGLETPLEAEVWLQLKCGCRCAPSILAAGWAHVLQWPDRQRCLCAGRSSSSKGRSTLAQPHSGKIVRNGVEKGPQNFRLRRQFSPPKTPFT
jgi:hypothetical protein